MANHRRRRTRRQGGSVDGTRWRGNTKGRHKAKYEAIAQPYEGPGAAGDPLFLGIIHELYHRAGVMDPLVAAVVHLYAGADRGRRDVAVDWWCEQLSGRPSLATHDLLGRFRELFGIDTVG